jgi:hypothetical protein
MIPEVLECDERDNSDTAYTWSDQSGSDEEIPPMSTTSAIFILWSYDEFLQNCSINR